MIFLYREIIFTNFIMLNRFIKMKYFILKKYLRLFNFIASKRIIANDLPEQFIHAHLVSVLATGILMWSYAIVASLTISHPLPGIVGIICSSVHLLSPLLYRQTNNYFFNSNVFIGAGIIHQSTFSFFTGGFDSNILIWLGILPMLSGVIAGRRGAITWAFITGVVVFSFLLLKLAGFPFPNLISEQGQIISQALSLFGWIFIATVVIWVHVLLVEQNTEKLEQSHKRNQNLVNILSHDIATPIMVIVDKLKKLLKDPLMDTHRPDLVKATKAAERLVEITKSVRELRLSEMDKKDVTFAEVKLSDVVLELKEAFIERLAQKNLKFNYWIADDAHVIYSNRSLLLHQILSNLLINAIKFSPYEGEINLSIRKVDNYRTEFLLSDHGVGIPPEMRDHIFEANYSKSSLGTIGEVGTGFGLPIVKNCVEKLGGSISFETRTLEEGDPGTSFKILL